MWSCSACAIRIRFRMYCAFGGTWMPAAFSTARTDAIACTVVHTPQNLCANSHASRGSRPCRIVSIPRNIVPDAHESATLPPSTFTSIRRCPSIRVIGSIVMRLLIAHSPRYKVSNGRMASSAAIFPGEAGRIANVFTAYRNTATASAVNPILIRISKVDGK